MKRLLSALLASAFLLFSSVPAFAAMEGVMGDNRDPASEQQSSSRAAPLGLSLDHTSVAVQVGDVNVLNAYLNGVPTANVTWSISDSSVATVSGGVVSGLKLGTARVTASDSNGQTASCYVHVARKGIDVSQWQGNINWSAVASSGVDFAIIRTGYGKTAPEKQTDTKFASNYTGAVQNGLKVGAYHYSYAETVEDARQEAAFCLSILNGRTLNYPVFYDVEEAVHRTISKETMADIVEAFCSTIQAAGYQTGVYSYTSLLNSSLSSSRLDKYDRWVASWGRDLPNYSKPYTIWQYAYGTVDGISGNTDLNYSFVDYPSQGGTTQPIPPALPETPPVTPPSTMICDTPYYTFSTNSAYYYKIMTNSAGIPTAYSSDPAVVTVSYGKAVNGGHIFQINRVASGTATITTTSAEGASVSFNATVPAVSVPTTYLSCDTTHPYTFGSNSVYYYKVSTNSSAVPTAVSTNPSAVAVSYGKAVSGGHVFQITNIGAGTATITTSTPDGLSVSFQATGKSSSTTAPPAAGGLKCDTTYPLTMQPGKLYTFLFTPGKGVGVPSFTTGNGSIVTTAGVKTRNGSYLVTVKAVKKGSTGIYAALPGQKPLLYCTIRVT